MYSKILLLVLAVSSLENFASDKNSTKTVQHRKKTPQGKIDKTSQAISYWGLSDWGGSEEIADLQKVLNSNCCQAREEILVEDMQKKQEEFLLALENIRKGYAQRGLRLFTNRLERPLIFTKAQTSDGATIRRFCCCYSWSEKATRRELISRLAANIENLEEISEKIIEDSYFR